MAFLVSMLDFREKKSWAPDFLSAAFRLIVGMVLLMVSRNLAVAPVEVGS